MAFVKKPLQGGVKEFLEDYSVDLENRIDSGIKTYISQERIYHSNIISGLLWVRRYNDELVSIAGKDLKFVTTENGTLIGELPQDYAPFSDVVIPVFNTFDGSVNIGIVVSPSGKVSIRTYRGISMSSTGNFTFNTTYRK